MIELSLAEVRTRASGELTVAPGTDRVSGIRTDSRLVGPGELFVAVGRGRDFVQEALARGAAAALVPDDAHAALAALASAVRARSPARFVGVTGSTGKTSTKDILAALCRPHARTVASEGGHNNEIGVPLTVFHVEPDTEVVVAEMAMRGLGQISALASVVRPHVGVITAVGPVHLELVGTVERVAQAKAELLAWLPEGGTAVVPAHAPELEPHLPRERVELVRFGEGGDVVLERFDPPALDARVGEERVELEVPFTALHQAHNTLAALAAYRALGLPLERAAEGASGIAISPWRCEDVELPGGGLLVNDVYNANPASMVAALDHLRRRAAGGRTIAVLGGMAELGEESPRYHREVAEEARVDVLVAVGEAAREYLGAPAGERHWVETTEEAAALVRTLLRPGDAVLVKASRAYGLEAVADEILAVTA